ncbi:Outer membrane cobalamin receptor protein, SusC/RagA family [Bacteroidales bacterium Barb7]|nr:Outer membrane cobalamin receptor protein, SusC/RagA family [Bacteroidales bacterium Barb7]
MARRVLMFMVMVHSAALLIAQTINITGVVNEAGVGPIVGATVIVQGTSVGTVTDINGSYAVSAPKDGVLEFRYIGLETSVVPVSGRTAINVELQSGSIGMDEVVVVGYGTQKRRTVTASVASINGESFRDVPNPNAESALQGRAAGVSIITPSGAVGQAPVVRVRGVSSITSGTEPLYVVDGVPVETGNTSYVGNINALADINPSDILSMDVLKDAAAAALYGSRAANGVVLITTRKGQQDKARISYNGWVGITTPSKLIDVMNTKQYVDFKNLSVANRYGTDERSNTPGYASPHGSKAYNLWTLPDGQYVDTYWNDYLYQTGLQHNHSVSASGGSEKIQYYISANYTNQKGMVVNDHYDRLGGAANVTAKATDWLKLGINLNATTSTTSYTDRGRKGSQYATDNFSRLGMILPPNIPARDPATGAPYYNGSSIGYGPNTVAVTYYNPVALLEFGDRQLSDVARVISSYFAEIRPVAGLALKTQLGIDYMTVGDEQFFNSYTGDGFSPGGQARNAQTKNLATTWTNTAQYSFSVNDHNFDLLAGVETYTKDRKRWGADREGLLDTKFTVFQADYANIYPYGNLIEESSLMSYLGRINYDYKAKYMLSVNFRRDGYSALSKNHRWGNFGGASAAWRISEEAFFAPVTFINDLKIKGSWGVVGNTSIGAYAAKSYYTSGYYGSNGEYSLANIADTENLKWEASTKLDIGFAAQLFRNVNVEFDYYKNNASDLILNVPVAPSKGIPGNSITTNTGEMSNTGIEFSVSATPVKTADFSWTTSFNITTQHNEVIKLADGINEIIGGNDYNITLPGYSIGQLYIRPSAGIDPETGRRIMIGKDGTEVLVQYENPGNYFRKDDGTSYAQSNITQRISGGTMPTYYGGWTNDFKYKSFDLAILLQYSGGNYIYNGSTATLSDMRFWNNSTDVYNNAWRNSGDKAKYAKPIYADNVSNGSSMPISDWIEKGDYLRLKNITLGYTFNTRNWGRAGISSLRVYASAQNLFCLTGYSGLDPESLISANDQAALQGGVDKNALPQAKVFTFGVNIGF